jgi:hypothetical protein
MGIAIAGLNWAEGGQLNDTGVMMEHELSDESDKSTQGNKVEYKKQKSLNFSY